MSAHKKPGSAGGRNPGLPKSDEKNHNAVTAAAQRARLLAELKLRKLTTLSARRDIDVLHVAARVMELRREGYPIETVWTTDVTSEGFTHRVARYELTGEKAQHELF